MASWDTKDSTSANVKMPDLLQNIRKGVKGLRVGIPKEYIIDGMSDEIKKLLDHGRTWLKDMGAEIIDISLPHTKVALPCYYIIAPAEASSKLS